MPPHWYFGKRIAVDGHNITFRYLASIRGADGDILRNPQGRAIGHLIGYVNLVRHLRSRGAEPIVVWDGPVQDQKRGTVNERITRRLEAALNAEEALAAGDHAAHQKYLRATTYIDAGMIKDATRLLGALGVSVVRADHDGERYAAALCLAGHAEAVATEDFDALVAGAPAVLRRAGSADPFMHNLADVAAQGLTPVQLRHIAILCGTDWNDGVKGFGAKTALKALREEPDLRAIIQAAHAGGTKRYHQLIREAGLTLAEFDEIDAFIAAMPTVAAPAAARPDPAAAATAADELFLARDRVMACFC